MERTGARLEAYDHRYANEPRVQIVDARDKPSYKSFSIFIPVPQEATTSCGH